MCARRVTAGTQAVDRRVDGAKRPAKKNLAGSWAVSRKQHKPDLLSKKLIEMLLSAAGGRNHDLLQSDLYTRILSSERLLACAVAGLGERLSPGPRLLAPGPPIVARRRRQES